MISSTVAVSGMLTVLEMAPLRKWLRRRHHSQVRHVTETALAAIGLEGAIENGEVFRS